MKEYDVVELIKSVPEHGLIKGQQGTILEIYNKLDCEIEFSNENGITLYLGSMPMKYLKLVCSN